MRHSLTFYFLMNLLVFIFFNTPLSISAQNCSGMIIDNRVVGNTHFLRAATMTLIVRGDYSYELEFSNNEKGVSARITSKNGVEFNQGDEMIFVDVNNTRKTYRFVEMGDVRGRIFQNVLQLDMPAMAWFSETTITTFYILSKVTYEMRKFTIPDNRQVEFKNLASCFIQSLDKTKVKNVTVNTESAGFKPQPQATSAAAGGSNTAGGQVVRKADISQLNDKELADLRRELAETKDKIRAEIAAEKEKAAREKQKIQDDVMSARQMGEQKKAEFAKEVVEARQRSQVMIDSAGRQFTNMVVESQKKAGSEMEKIAHGMAMDTQINYQDLKGNLYTSTAEEILMHVVNHGTYHRGQIITLLRQCGFTEVGSTDFMRFLRK